MVDLLRARIETDRELVRRGTLADFFRMVWPLVDPATLVWNWHLDEKCKHLEAMSRGEIRRLIINEPPGCGKSNLANVIWDVWEWIQRPATKFIYASYDPTLVGTRDGGKVIRVLQSDWFRLRWGDILGPGKPAASMFETRSGGFRFATSPGGKGTGRHADIRVVDDPLKPKDATGGATMTRNALRAVVQWWADTMSSRATDQTTVRDLLIMQRLHEDDLAGDWLAKTVGADLVHLCFPMIYDPAIACKTRWGGDRRTDPGYAASVLEALEKRSLTDDQKLLLDSLLLFPRRYPLDVVLKMFEFDMGPDVFAAQCQQRPTRKGGTIFRREWWNFWHYQEGVPEPCRCDQCWSAKRTLPGHVQPRSCEVLPHLGFEVQSWDCAFKDKSDSDFVSGGVFRENQGRIFMLDLVNERLSFTDTIREVRNLAVRWPRAYDKLIEDKANGTAVENVLRTEIPGLTLVEPGGSKEARAHAGSVWMSSGKFYLPHPDLFPWVWSFLSQHERFPRASNDDMVDMTSQLLNRLKTHGEHFAEAMRKLRGEQ